MELQKTCKQVDTTKIDVKLSEFKKFSSFGLINLCLGMIGLQFAMGLQVALSSRVLEPLGADPFLFGLIWCAGPMTGLIVQPIVGAWSDRTRTKLGRRRPFIIVGSILAAISLLLFPFSPMLAIAACLIWIIDASVNLSQGPYRALIPDNIHPKQHPVANSYLNFAVGAGYVISLGVSPLLSLFNIQMSLTQQYLMSSFALLLCVLYTCLTIKERPTEELAVEDKQEKKSLLLSFKVFAKSDREIHKLCFVQFLTWIGVMCMFIYLTNFVVHKVYLLPDMSTKSYKAVENEYNSVSKETLAGIRGISTFEMANNSVVIKNNLKNGIENKDESKKFETFNSEIDKIMKSSIKEPKKYDEIASKFKKLALSHGSINSAGYFAKLTELKTFTLMKKIESEATNTAQIALVAFNLVTILLSIPLGYLCTRYSKKLIYSICLGCMGTAFAFAPFIATPVQVITMMAVAGIAWATILSIPFAILCDYIQKGEEGVLMGIFNMFIAGPQLISATVISCIITMSPIKTIFGQTHNWSIAFITASVFVYLAIVALQFIKEKK